jgi:phosphoserine phosphatase
VTKRPIEPLCGARASGVVRDLQAPAPGSTCLIIDADRTLAPQDTGRIVGRALGIDGRIRAVFETLGYTTEAFRRVSEIWSEVPLDLYERHLDECEPQVALHALWLDVWAAVKGRVAVIAITAGIPQVWRRALKRHGLDGVPVVGGVHSGLDEYFVCPAGKAALVESIRRMQVRVIAVGDSLIDLPMLKSADRAVFVPDRKGSPGLFAQLHTVPGVRHAAVDDRTFEGLRRCAADEIAGMLLRGGHWDAD